MRSNRNRDGNFEYKWLELPISTRKKRRFVRWCERNNWSIFDGYDRLIKTDSLEVSDTKTLYNNLNK